MTQREKPATESRWTKIHRPFTNAIIGYFKHPETVPCDYLPQKFNYIFRRKSKWELTRISAIVSGIEFCYAAETAFVTPLLLSLGLNVKYVSMIWCLSPFLAFVFAPILGSFSDSCNSKFGRRRPFVFILSLGIIVGLIFVPYGGRIGLLLGDSVIETSVGKQMAPTNFVNSTEVTVLDLPKQSLLKRIKMEIISKNRIPNDSFINLTAFEGNENIYALQSNISELDAEDNNLDSDFELSSKVNNHGIGIVLTFIGTIFLDFCADVCQSPARAYLLDITLPEEHVSGLAIFSLNSGMGAAVGYAIAAIKWDVRLWRNVLEGQVIVAFAFITVLFLSFLFSSLYSFPEIPMPLLKDPLMFKEYQEKMLKKQTQSDTEMSILPQNPSQCSPIKNKVMITTPVVKGIIEANGDTSIETSSNDLKPKETQQPSLKEYLKSIIFLSKSLRILSLTNFFYGLGVMSYAIFFTNFVGECVFGGNPQAPKDSESYRIYKEGVRFGCWGMAFGSLTSAICSSFIEDLAKKWGAKAIFVGGALVFSAGMLLMAVTRHKVLVIILSSTSGVMYATLTMPFILISHYHTSPEVQESNKKDNRCTRGIGTDIATIISIIVLAQCILSSSMGTVVEAVGSSIVTMYSAALFSACGAMLATQVMYFGM